VVVVVALVVQEQTVVQLPIQEMPLQYKAHLDKVIQVATDIMTVAALAEQVVRDPHLRSQVLR
jgi:hypothetical protein